MATPTITQEKLKAYYDMKLQTDTLQKKLDALRQELLDLHGMKAEVESGPFSLEVNHVSEERVNAKALVEAVAKEFGEEKAKEMKSAASKSNEYDRLNVRLRGA